MKFTQVDLNELPVGVDEKIEAPLSKKTTRNVKPKYSTGAVKEKNDPILFPNAKRKHPLAECEKCPLYPQKSAPSILPSDAVCGVVSRSPGKHDTSVGKPFAGPSGAILDGLLKANGVSRAQTAVTNVVLCQAEKVPDAAVRACRPRLKAETDGIRNLILCGAEATSEFLGEGGVYKLRGIKHTLPDGRTATVTFNPAAAIRNESIFPDLQLDFARAFRDRAKFTPPNVIWTDDVREARKLAERIVECSFVSCDIEATGLSAFSTLVSIGFTVSESEAIVFGRRVCQSGDGWKLIKSIVERPDITFLWHNGQYDVKVLRTLGIDARIGDDTLLLSYACDERSDRVHGLEYLVRNRLDWPNYESEEVSIGKKNSFSMLPWFSFTRKKVKYNVKRPFDSWDDLYRYNGFDVCGPHQLYKGLVEEAKSDGTYTVYRRLLVPGANMLADVERFGVRFDVEKAHEVNETYIKPELERINQQASELIGDAINLNSVPQVQKVVYEKYGCADPRVNKTTPKSTDADSIEALLKIVTNPAARKFLTVLSEQRKVEKLRNTYVEKLPQMVDADGRLRGNFNIARVETGRLSSDKPNLQNQPRGPLIRQCYIASPGNRIVQADYSQAELRATSILSNDGALQQVYHDGRDLHSEVATRFFGANFTKEQRVIAKNINFGIVYQQSAKGFAEMYDIPVKEAQRYINEWFELYPDVRKWVERNNRLALSQQYVRQVTGRVRRFPLITDNNRESIKRQAVNCLVQGPASDFTLWAAIQWNRMHPQTIVLLVHDSINLDVPEDKAEELGEELREVMMAAPYELLEDDEWRKIPFNVDVDIGPDWGHVE